ncbi:uncharacterized protein LOC143620781 [Bidens hawaiensis]|uniref:uncharacterized protein LOC143620781 n=1 Tax=Bidens hawaiensis TaxID=980011 RepID=UPI004049039D
MLTAHLLEHGYKRGTIDQTLFIKIVGKDLILVQIYVNDIIFGSMSIALCSVFEEVMKKRFEMSSLREMTMFGFTGSSKLDRYLKGQPKLGLWYPNNSEFDLSAFSDSNYGGDDIDRKSTSTGCQFLGNGLFRGTARNNKRCP